MVPSISHDSFCNVQTFLVLTRTRRDRNSIMLARKLYLTIIHLNSALHRLLLVIIGQVALATNRCELELLSAFLDIRLVNKQTDLQFGYLDRKSRTGTSFFKYPNCRSVCLLTSLLDMTVWCFSGCFSAGADGNNEGGCEEHMR
jgi:hypothetical protein